MTNSLCRLFLTAICQIAILAGSANLTAADTVTTGKSTQADYDSREDSLSLLGEEDRARYKAIFDAQEVGDWQTADGLIALLENDILLGHVQYQRYMHPTAYRSKFSELRDWLARYGDHPDAQRVYRLAKRRQGRANPPPRPVAWKRIYGAGAAPQAHPDTPTRSAYEKRIVRDFKSRLSYEVRRRHSDRGEKRYWAIERLDLLAPHEEAEALGKLAFSYLFAGNDLKARALAKRGSDLSPGFAEDANWYGGLAAWRLNDCQTAFTLFSRLADTDHVGAWQKSAGSVWAARAALACEMPERVTPYLQKAAAENETFYGLIAIRQLGHLPQHDWSLPPLEHVQLNKLLSIGSVTRAIALTEIGESHLADEEMRLALGRTDREDWPALAALAARLRLPASQMRVALALEDTELPTALHYPVPDWTPEGGFTVDRAILFAFIRQESKFLARAKSRAGASGLMQVLPSTASYISGDRSLRWQRARLYEPRFNMSLGQQYIEHLSELPVVEGNLFMLASAYNGGPGNLSRWRRITDYQNDPLLYIETIPARETRNYVERVMANLWLYRMQLGQETPSLDAVSSNAWPIYETLENENSPVIAQGHPPYTSGSTHAGN